MAFPTTPILDDFNRANEGPPPSANWSTPNYLGNFWGIKVVSNHCEVASIPDDVGSGTWTTQIGPDCEVYCDYIAGTINSSSVILGIRFDISDLWMGATGNEGSGYMVTCQPGDPGITGWTFQLTRTDPGFVSLGTDTTTVVAIGDSFGISAIGTSIKVYHKPSAGSWTEVISVTDATYNRAGYAGVQLVYAVDKIDNFGGGTLAPAPAPPVADFSATPTSGTVALSVDFTDLTTNTPTSWYWDFGDGGSSTSQNPTHVYNYIGTYTVNLTATNAQGSDIETKVAYITVTAVVEYGPAEVENCDVDTGGAAVGLRVADVAIARDNIFGSVTIDASAELRAKDNAYDTLVNNGTLTSLGGDRSAWDTTNFAALHARDIDEATGTYHLVSAVTQTYTISNPSTDRSYDVTGLTLNELAAVVGTLIADLQAKGLLS